jgi:tetratricopeptide (TPR) repeat protein
MKRRLSRELLAALPAAVVLLLPYLSPLVYAQGIAETGALYAMPKGISDAHSLAGPLTGAYSRHKSVTAAPAKVEADEDEDPQAAVKSAGRQSIKIWLEARRLEKEGHIAQAEALYRQALAIRRPIWGDQDPAVPQLLRVIGMSEEKQGALAQAEQLYRQELSVTAKKYGPGSWELCEPLTNLARVLGAQKNYKEAGSSLKTVLELTRRKFGDGDPRTARASARLADALTAAGQTSEARQLQETFPRATSSAGPIPASR